jgi:hypothetical protein
MNYCTIEDAWKNSDYISDQFRLYENPYEKKNIIENFDSNIKPVNYNDSSYNNNLTTHTIVNKPDEKVVPSSPVVASQQSVCSFTCDDFWEHLNTCETCRKKIRDRFSSRLVENIQNVVLDNKDTILLVLIAFFILVFFNLLVSIFKK